jgi:hypothetical protein
MARAPVRPLASGLMLLTDWMRWPVLSNDKACRNALRGALESARYRRDWEDAEQFLQEVSERSRSSW